MPHRPIPPLGEGHAPAGGTLGSDDQSSAPELLQAAPTTRWPAAFRSLRYRDFRIFWGGQVISVIGTWMQHTAQGWLVYQLTNSSLYLGLVGACSAAPMLLFTLPAGVVADRCNKRKIVLVTQSLATLQAFGLAALVYTDVVRVWHVMLMAAALGVINAFDMPTRQSMPLELVGREDVLNAVSLNSSAFNSGRVIGPTIAGLLVASAGLGGCFLINAISFVPVVIALAVIRLRPVPKAAGGSMTTHIKEGLSWVRGQPIAVALLTLTAVFSVFAMPYATLLPVFARDVFRTGPRGLGFMHSAYGLGAVTAALWLAARGHRWRLGALATGGSFLFAIALVAVGWSPEYALAILFLFLTGLGLMTFNAVSNTMLQRDPPDELRGRVVSLRVFLFAGFAPLGSLQIGAMGQWLGPRLAVAISGLVCLATALLARWRVPALWRKE